MHLRILPTQDLIAEVEPDVAEPGSEGVFVQNRNGVAHLVQLADERPLLREGVGPRRPAVRSAQGVDVLNDSRLLIVRLFDQEAVVGDRGLLGECGLREEKGEE